jgi:hypothetical protein
MLKFFYGTRPDVGGMIFIHLAGIVTGFAALQMLPAGDPSGLAGRVLVFLLGLDLGGGVIANGTRSTNDWYATRPLRLSYAFLLAHMVQPVLMALAASLPWSTAAFLYLYQLVAGSTVLGARGRDEQRPIAAVFLVVGLLVYFAVFLPPPGLIWFGVLYLLKLVMMFSVDHYAGLGSRRN